MKNFDFIAEVKSILRNNSSVKVVKNVFNSHFPVWCKSSNSNSNGFIYNKECPDVYVGEIINGNVCIGSTWFDNTSRYNAYKQNHLLNTRNTNYKTIVIILESPHDEEYNYSFQNFINPALGNTGVNMKDHYVHLINAVIKLFPYMANWTSRIILMNSIQYQCSLGKIKFQSGSKNKNGLNPTIRNLIFSSLWKCPRVKTDFITRLHKYNPDIIINLCTQGRNKTNNNPWLRDLVQQEINNNRTMFTNAKYYIEGYHPSNWKITKNNKPYKFNEIWESGKRSKNAFFK